MNMAMIFVLHPLSHYNSITKPCARFLLSLLEHLSIDFPSHFVLFILDVYRDLATRDKLIFPSAITRILLNFYVPFPLSENFFIMGVIDAATVNGVRHSFSQDGPGQQLLPLLQLYPHPLPLLLQTVRLSRISWRSFSAWMLASTLSVMSCVR